VEDEILFQGAGYTIARTARAETSVPYGAAARHDGNRNYGWIDVRGRPELVDSIPEVQRSTGLAHLLRAIAAPQSPIMSSACECAAFERVGESNRRWQVGGFVVVMFQDADLNADSQNLVNLATQILRGIAPTQEHQIGFELTIEPLRTFFGRGDCFALMLKALGYGREEADAWSAFGYAASAAGDSITHAMG